MNIMLIGESEHIIRATCIDEALQLAHDSHILADHGGNERPLRGILGGLFNRPSAPANPMEGGQEAALVIQNGDAAPIVYNTEAGVVAIAAAMIAGVTARLWEMTVGARQYFVWGAGAFGNINNQGYIKFVLLDIAAGFQRDIIRLLVESADRNKRRTVKEFSDDLTHLADFTTLATATPINNQAGMLALPQTKVIALPFSRLAVEATCLVAPAATDHGYFSLPATRKTG